MKKIFYIETVDGMSQNNIGTALVNGSFFHGSLVSSELSDLAYMRIEDIGEPEMVIDLLKDAVFPCTVVYPNGREVEAYFYHWSSLSTYKWAEEGFVTRDMPSISKGLICAKNDVAANKDAIEKFNKRASFI